MNALSQSSSCTGRLIVTGPQTIRVVELGPAELTLVEAGDSMQLSREAGDRSRGAALLQPLAGGGHRLVDLGNEAGTFVNDVRVASAALGPFDRVRIGDHGFLYLDAATPADRVLRLVALANVSTPGSTSRSPLVERLMRLTLSVNDGDPGPGVAHTLERVLCDLSALTSASAAVLVVEQPEDGLRAVHAHADGVDAGLDDLARLRPLVSAALESGRVQVGEGPSGAACTLCVPLKGQTSAAGASHEWQQLRGALLVGAVTWRPSAEEERLLLALGRHVGSLLAGARLERQATTDPLTGLANRAQLQRVLTAELLRGRGGGAPTAVILLDIDDFKRVNDRYGHAVGDEVLGGIGDRLQSALRHTDAAGRWGGEEFLVVLPGQSVDGARQVADKLVRVLAATSDGPAGLRVTVSAGVAVTCGGTMDVRELVRRADVALYAAKAAGKNCAVLHHPDLEQTAPAGDLLPGLQTAHGRADAAPEPVVWLDCDMLASIPLHPGVASLGRSPTCDVVLPHRSISRQHAVISVSPDREHLLFEDCSRNGSLVNGVPVAGGVRLSPGDCLLVGPYELRVRRGAERDPLAKTDGGTTRGGRIEELRLCAFLARLATSRSTGRLGVQGEGVGGELLLRDGDPVCAQAGGAADLDAVRRFLRLQSGRYEFSSCAVDVPRRIPLTTSGMLMLACVAPDDGRPCCRRGPSALVKPQLDF